MNPEHVEHVRWLRGVQRNSKWLSVLFGALMPIGVIGAFMAGLFQQYTLIGPCVVAIIGGAILFHASASHSQWAEERVKYWSELP